MKNLKIIGFIVGLCACIGIGSAIHTKASSQTPSVTKPLTVIAAKELNVKLDEITNTYNDLNIGVAVIDLNTNQSYAYGEKAAYFGASTTKVLVASMYMHEAEIGKRKLRDNVNGSSASHQIALMIEQSDNEAWTALKDAIGRDNLNTYAHSIGLKSFVAQDNLINPGDMAILLQKLYSGTLLNQSDTQQLLGYMQRSVRNYISPALARDATVYHKAGWLDDRLMDTGIVTEGNKKYVIVIFCKSVMGTIDFTTGTDVMNSIVKAVNASIHVQ